MSLIVTSDCDEGGMNLVSWLDTKGLGDIREDLLKSNMTLSDVLHCTENDIKFHLYIHINITLCYYTFI